MVKRLLDIQVTKSDAVRKAKRQCDIWRKCVVMAVVESLWMIWLQTATCLPNPGVSECSELLLPLCQPQ